MLLDRFRKWKADRAELGEIESKNVFRRAELNAALTIVTTSRDAAEDNAVKSRHAKVIAQMEAIQDKISQAEKAVRNKDIVVARELDGLIGVAIMQLNVA